MKTTCLVEAHFSSTSTQSGEDFLKLMDAMEKEQESNRNRMQEIAAITELDETILNRLINRILIWEP